LSRRKYIPSASILPGNAEIELTDGVNTSTTAGITISGATRGRRSLGRGIGNRITRARATALEGVVEANPVTDFVSDSLSEVVVGGRASGERGIEDN